MTSTAFKKYFSGKTFIFGLAGILISFLILFWAVDAQTASGLSGYAWSSNIGWIQTNPIFGGVTLTNNVFSGYAWSSNIGWINFNPAGPYPENPQTGVRFNPTNKSITGWARALSYGGGWDGWIKMSGTASNGNLYGVVSSPTGLLSGYAWGDDVVGWVDFSRVTCNGCIGVVTPVVNELTIVKNGNGSVVGDVPCATGETQCKKTYSGITNVALTAVVGSGSTFGSWSGCNSVVGLVCNVTVQGIKTVTVNFNSVGGPNDARLTVMRDFINGGGGSFTTSIPSGIDCGTQCIKDYKKMNPPTTVDLTAVPNEGSTLTWSSNCVVGADPNRCTVTMNESKTVRTIFKKDVTIPTDNSFTLEGCTNQIAGKCVLVVQCDKVGVDCAGGEVHSDDSFTVNYTGNSEGPVTYAFSTTGSPIPEWLRVTDCGASGANNSSCSSVGSGGSMSKTGSFILRAKELLNSGDVVGGSYAKIVKISTSSHNFEFILRLIPKSGGGQ